MFQLQQDFLKTEIWLLTFGGAFQRNKVYKEGVTEKQRESFRIELRKYIESDILPTYQKTLTEEKHRAMIFAIAEHSTIYEAILINDRLSIGTSQKLLNLVLKYYWCLGWLAEPLHFPVDRQIQKSLPAKNRMSWTKITSLDEYQGVIDCARGLLKEGESLARWELDNFKRT